MNRYVVKLFDRAYRDIDEIYEYIAKTLLEPGTAENMMNILEEAILSLGLMPERGAIRRVGAYANRGYRQLFIKNYIVIYRVDKEKEEVYIVTIRYSGSQF